MVIDTKLSIVGTANMDNRSFHLNFEVNAIVYDAELATELRASFYKDLEDAEEIDAVAWDERSLYKQLIEKITRLVSSLL
jgi:cardiolipin synthase A/B